MVTYAQRFGAVLQTGDATPLVNLQSAAVRHHAMEALSALSKYMGRYNVWKDIREKYQLHWTSGNESLAAFERFFMDDNKSLESMLRYVREAPSKYKDIFVFNCLTGLRPSECLEAIRLINNVDSGQRYYNESRQCLEHFRYPQIFLRSTKSACISVVDDQIIEIAKKIGPTSRVQCHKEGNSS
jgi:hypothetical protein